LIAGISPGACNRTAPKGRSGVGGDRGGSGSGRRVTGEPHPLAEAARVLAVVVFVVVLVVLLVAGLLARLILALVELGRRVLLSGVVVFGFV
jgi:hypothetical protein